MRRAPDSTVPCHSFKRPTLDCVGTDEAWDVMWRGTGKHPPCLFAYTARDNAVRGLIDCGMVLVDSQRMRLSPRGAAFLSMLHPDCEDPDVMCRWRTGGTPTIGPEHAGATRDWIMRFFSKMKTAVNRIGREEGTPDA